MIVPNYDFKTKKKIIEMSFNDGGGGNDGPKIGYANSIPETYEETAVKNDLTLSAKAVGSIAGRAQAWER